MRIPLPADPGRGGLPEERGALRWWPSGPVAWWRGGAGPNFYNDQPAAYGCADEAAAIQDLHPTGRAEEAAAAVPNELARDTARIGTETEVRGRVRVLRASGFKTISVKALARSRGGRIEQLEALRVILG